MVLTQASATFPECSKVHDTDHSDAGSKGRGPAKLPLVEDGFRAGAGGFGQSTGGNQGIPKEDGPKRENRSQFVSICQFARCK